MVKKTRMVKKVELQPRGDPVSTPHESENKPILVINIRQSNPSRRVRFNNEIVTHVIEIEDRKGYWVEDSFRFQQRCMSVKDAISFIFDEVHRRKMRLIVNLSLEKATILKEASVPYTSGMYSSTVLSNISRDHTIMRIQGPVVKAILPLVLPTLRRS
jgi:hypothetical protein